MALRTPITIVEQDANEAARIGQMLSKHGYLPVQCFSKKMALAFASEGNVVLINLDQADIEDVHTITEIRKHNPGIKIVAMSENWRHQSLEHAIRDARRMGANWALKKPYTADELHEAIACVLAPPAPEFSAQAAPTKTVDLHVVLADDDPVSGKLIRRILERYLTDDIPQLENGEQVLNHIRNGQPVDLLILDLRMPGMDGITLLRHLAEQHFTGGICLVSGEGEDILKSVKRLGEGHDLNVVGALKKPVTIEAMSMVFQAFVATTAKQRLETPPPFDESDLHRAVQEGGLENHYQPRIDVATGRCVGMEALVRWRHPDLGLIYPRTFLPFAFEHGLADLLTHAVLIAALPAHAAWRDAGLDITLSVNLASGLLQDLSFPDRLIDLTEQFSCPADRLMLETNADAVMDAGQIDLEILNRLKLHGFKLSLDNYGTGRSFISHLESAPFNEVKIDRSLIAGGGTDSGKQAIIRAVVGMARDLGMTTVAEGVETQDDMAAIRRQGLDFAQGFLFASPMPRDAVLPWTDAAAHGPTSAS